MDEYGWAEIGDIMPAIKANGDSRILMTVIGKLPTHDLNQTIFPKAAGKAWAGFGFIWQSIRHCGSNRSS